MAFKSYNTKLVHDFYPHTFFTIHSRYRLIDIQEKADAAIPFPRPSWSERCPFGSPIYEGIWIMLMIPKLHHPVSHDKSSKPPSWTPPAKSMIRRLPEKKSKLRYSQPSPPHTPRILRASCMSFAIIVTRLACIAQRFVSSNRWTKNASAASCKAWMACDCHLNSSFLGRSVKAISRTYNGHR